MKKGIIICLVLFYACTLIGQQEIKMSLDKYNEEKEAILNTVINSVPFDSINNTYLDSSLFFVFAENEILYKDIPIKLTYKNQKVEIMDCSQINEYCYWIGDFFLNAYVENPKEARVQIELTLKGKEILNMGISLKKEEKWEITDFVFID
jgi:hypothetical protein